MRIQPGNAYSNCGRPGDLPAAGPVHCCQVLATTSHQTKDGTVHNNTEWHPVVCWHNTAELTEKFVTRAVT
jgi:single-stranded DNA-binding protein